MMFPEAISVDRRSFFSIVVFIRDENKLAEPCLCKPREETLFALSDLFIELRRDPNQRIPYGLTMPPTSKSRIMALPPRLPQATWEVILRYILEKPADWANLESDEAIPEKVLYPGIDAEE